MGKRNLAALALVLALRPGLAEAANRWFVVESANFRIYSDGSQKDVNQLAIELDRFRRVVTQLYKLQPSEQPFAVVAFRDPSAFDPFRPSIGLHVGTLSYAVKFGIEDMAALALYERSPEEREVMFHEYFHALTEAGYNDWPRWLEEGAAEVFSTYEERGGKIVLGIAKPQYVKFLRAHGLMSMTDLLTGNLSSDEKVSAYYPQAWALTHYLMFADNQAHLNQLVDFLNLWRDGSDDASAFQKAFGIAPTGLQKNLENHIQNEQYPAWEIPLTNMEADGKLTTRPISDAERDCIFGNLMFSTLDVGRAEYYFKRAHARDPDLPMAYEGLGYGAATRGRFVDARKWFDQAAAHGTTNYRVYYYCAAILYAEQAGDQRFASSMPRDTTVAIVELLKKSITLRPTYASSYELLARLSLNPGENPEEGMKLIQHALQYHPRHNWFLLTEVKLQIRLHDYEAAHKTLEPLLRKDVRDEDLKREARAAQKELDALTQEQSKH